MIFFWRWLRVRIFRIRLPRLTGLDPSVFLGGGRYHLTVDVPGRIRYGYQFCVTREDLEILAEMITGLLEDTELYSDGTYRAKEIIP